MVHHDPTSVNGVSMTELTEAQKQAVAKAKAELTETSVESPPGYNPFAPEELLEESSTSGGINEEVTLVPVRRPSKTEFFRVYSDNSYSCLCVLMVREDGMDKDYYWVPRSVSQKFGPELGLPIREVRLFTCITRYGDIFLWPIPRSADGRGSSWSESATIVAQAATTQWVRLVPQTQPVSGMYDFLKANIDMGEPRWPNLTFEQLLELAFPADKDKIILGTGHPFVRNLLGEV